MASTVWGQVNYLPNGYVLKLDANENVPPEFWSYEIPFNPVAGSVTFIDVKVNLIKQQPIELNGEEDDSKSKTDKKIVDDIIVALKQAGVTLSDDGRFGTPEQCVSQFEIKRINTSDLYLWDVDTLTFLINSTEPSKVVLLPFASDDDDAENEAVDSAIVQKLSSNVQRVFFNLSTPCNGCGAGTCQWLSIIDFDFSHETWVTYDFPNISYWIDLNQDGNVEVVISPAIDDMVHFPWVYSWDGTKWTDSRAEFWKCYQSGKLGPMAYCGSGSLSKAPNALAKAIKAKEPLKYWKNSTSAGF